MFCIFCVIWIFCIFFIIRLLFVISFPRTYHIIGLSVLLYFCLWICICLYICSFLDPVCRISCIQNQFVILSSKMFHITGVSVLILKLLWTIAAIECFIHHCMHVHQSCPERRRSLAAALCGDGRPLRSPTGQFCLSSALQWVGNSGQPHIQIHNELLQWIWGSKFVDHSWFRYLSSCEEEDDQSEASEAHCMSYPPGKALDS